MENLCFQYSKETGVSNIFGKLGKIYDRLIDAESKELFMKRLCLSATEEVTMIGGIIRSSGEGEKLVAKLSDYRGIWIYGAGVRGDRIAKAFPDFNWIGYIDACKTGMLNSIKIYKLDNVTVAKDECILVTNYKGYEEIVEELILKGVLLENIIVLSLYEKKHQQRQYFDLEQVNGFQDKLGLFLDCGCYDGVDTIKYKGKKPDGKVYAFEPDLENFYECKERLKIYEDVTLYQIGLSNEKREVYFNGGNGETSNIDADGENRIQLDTIDNVVQDEKVSFIKMDIEGSEKEAIEGAKRVILRDKPDMAISVYHKKEDIIEIPMTILDINPSYEFMLRHYSAGSANDTVLYAFERGQ